MQPYIIFWRDLHIGLVTKHINIDFSFELISFGILDKVHSRCSKNVIIFTAKQFIFINKYNKTIPDITNFKHYLYKQISMNRDKLEIHEQKWTNILTE